LAQPTWAQELAAESTALLQWLFGRLRWLDDQLGAKASTGATAAPVNGAATAGVGAAGLANGSAGGQPSNGPPGGAGGVPLAGSQAPAVAAPAGR